MHATKSTGNQKHFSRASLGFKAFTEKYKTVEGVVFSPNFSKLVLVLYGALACYICNV